jgi:predicted ATPase
LTYEDNAQSIKLSAERNSKQLRLGVSVIDPTLTIPTMDPAEIDFLFSRDGAQADLFEDYQLRYSDHEVFQYILKINAPVFLGLERTHSWPRDDARKAYYERERLVSSQRSGLRGKRIVQGSLAAGLMETQALVADAYSRLRRAEARYSQRLRESIILSAFRYYETSSIFESVESRPRGWEGQRQILDRKREIAHALKNIGLSGERITEQLESFFGRLESLFRTMDSAGEVDEINVDWLLNKAQIDRVSDLIGIIDEHNSKIDKTYAPITKLIDSVNAFYRDTGKELQIDAVGQLSILRPDKKQAPIEALSSGERQLLIIFAHLLFNPFGSRSNIFIIDEPELSLHLKWQERFVSSAIAVSPNTQLILATHSPEIVAGNEQYGVAV